MTIPESPRSHSQQYVRITVQITANYKYKAQGNIDFYDTGIKYLNEWAEMINNSFKKAKRISWENDTDI